MSIALGEYIHAKYDNYMEHGLSKIEEGGERPNIDEILNNQRKIVKYQAQRMMSPIKNKDQFRNDLEKELNYFYNNQNETINDEDGNSIAIQDALVRSLQNNLLPKNFTVNNDLLVTQTSDSVNSIFGQLSEKTDFVYFKSIYSRLITIKRKAEDLRRDGKLTSDWSKWSDQASLLTKQFIQLQKDAENYSPGMGNLFGKQLKVLKSTTAEGKTQMNSFIKDVNDLIREVQGKTRAYWAGQVGELVPLITQKLVKQKIKITTYEQLNSLVKDIIENSEKYGQRGFLSSKAVIKGSLFKNFSDQIKDYTVDLSGNKHIEKYVAGLGKAKADLSYTQDKVDIELSLGGEKDILYSVKNYQLATSNEIKLLSGANIIYYLQQYPTFLNHYLNITAEHYNYSEEKISKQKKPPLSTVQDAHSVMIFSLALKAIAGGVLTEQKNGRVKNSQTAPVFLVNNSSGGRGGGYSVHYVDDFIDLIENNMNIIKLRGFNPNKRWKTNFYVESAGTNYSDAYKRILGLLFQLQTTKIKMSISKNALHYF